MSSLAHFKGKPVRRESLPEWASEQLPRLGTVKRMRDPDRSRGLTVLEAVEKTYVSKKTPTLLYVWSGGRKKGRQAIAPRDEPKGDRLDRRKTRKSESQGLPGLGGEILDRWYEYEVTSDGRVLRFMVFSAEQLKRSKEARALQADGLRQSLGITDRKFMEQCPELFRGANGTLPRRRPTIFFEWRNHGCKFLPNRRKLQHWREHGRIMNEPTDVRIILKKILETQVKQWTDPTTGRTFTPITQAELMKLTGFGQQEIAQYRDKRPHAALGRKIDFMEGYRSGSRTRVGFEDGASETQQGRRYRYSGFGYSREDGEKIKAYYEAKARGEIGKVAMAAVFLKDLVSAAPVKAGDGIKKACDAGFSSFTFRKAFKPAGLVCTRVGEESYWHMKDSAPPSIVSKKERAIQFLKKLLPSGTVVKAKDGMSIFGRGGFPLYLFYLARNDAGVQLTFLGKPGREGLHVWHLEGTDPKTKPKALNAIVASLLEHGVALSPIAAPQPYDPVGYPGHEKKPYETGRKADQDRESVLKFCYDEYVVKGDPRDDVISAAQRFFGVVHQRYLCSKDAVRDLACEWAERHSPPLPMNREIAAAKFRETA
jgi:hypothetical protein